MEGEGGDFVSDLSPLGNDASDYNIAEVSVDKEVDADAAADIRGNIENILSELENNDKTIREEEEENMQEVGEEEEENMQEVGEEEEENMQDEGEEEEDIMQEEGEEEENMQEEGEEEEIMQEEGEEGEEEEENMQEEGEEGEEGEEDEENDVNPNEEELKEDKVETNSKGRIQISRIKSRNKVKLGHFGKTINRYEHKPKSSRKKKLALGTAKRVAVEMVDDPESSRKRLAPRSSERVDLKNSPELGKRKKVSQASSKSISVENLDKRESSRKEISRGSSERIATKNEEKPESNKVRLAQGNSEKKVSKKVKSMGMIFMCSSKTKRDCYHYKVLGLPANKREIVEKVYKGMRLFLFDFDLRLMYGIYKAAGRGGYNIEPQAFQSQFPSQVRFTVFEDCLPLAEEKFKKVIKDNYYTKTKFDCQLNSEQVKKLCKLFMSSSKSSSSKMLGRSPVAGPRDKQWRPDLGGKNWYHERHIKYERRIIASPRAPLPQPRTLSASPPTYGYAKTLDMGSYVQDRFLEYPEHYRQEPVREIHDPYRRGRMIDLHDHDPYSTEHFVERSDTYRKDHLAEYRLPYRQDDFLEHRDSYRWHPLPEHHGHGSREFRDRLLENRDSYRQYPLQEHRDFYRDDSLLKHRDLPPPVIEPLHRNDARGDARVSYREIPMYRDHIHSDSWKHEYYSPEHRCVPSADYHPDRLSPDYHPA